MGDILMTEEERLWANALVDAIVYCLRIVLDYDADAYDANAWIELEERLDEEQVKRLWSHPSLGPVAKALDTFCFTAEHGRDIVFDDIRIGDLRGWLETCATLLQRGSMDFPSEIEVFR